MIISARITQALAKAGSSLQGLTDESLQEQLVELQAIEHDIHALTEDWAEPPESLRKEVNAMDVRFIVAGELFLDVCEHIQTALQSRDLAPLEEARTLLARAYEEIARAEEVANTQMKRWVQGGMLPKHPDVTG
jgi:hypothetical protein